MTEKITPETYEKMNEEFEEEGLPSESLFLHKNKSTNGEMKAIIYSNRNQECERAQSLLESCHLDETIVYYLDKDFTIRQFTDEFGEGSEFPQIALVINMLVVLRTPYTT